MKIIYITLFLLLSASGSHFSAQTNYNLDQCKRLALRNNQSIKNSYLNTDAAIEVSEGAFAKHFPSLSISGFGFKATDPFILMNMAEISGSIPEEGFMGTITLTKTLYAGGKLWNSNKLANIGIELSKQQARLSENNVLQQVENLYWELSGIYEKINTLDTLNRLLALLLDDVETACDAGLITHNDVLQVKLKQNEVKSNLMNLQNQTNLCKMLLCRQLGLKIEEAVRFNIERPDIHNIESPLNYYVDHHDALSGRAEDILLEKNVDVSKLQTKLKRSEYMPSVSAGVAYSTNNLTDNWERNDLFFVTVSIPVSGWWEGMHAIRKERINEHIAQNNRLEGKEQLLLQMQSVKNDLDNAYKQTLIAKETIEQSEENLRLNNDYYKAGKIPLTDVFDAQALMQQSRDKYVDASSQYYKKRFEYLQATGR